MRLKIQILLFVLLGLLCFSSFALAGPISAGIQSVGTAVYGTTTPKAPQELAGQIIRSALTFLGIIFVALVIYGGFLYMTSSGKEDKVKKAKDMILAAVIGLVIVISAYAIANFVLKTIINTQGEGYTGAGAPTGQH
jgi:hypothetical protein